MPRRPRELVANGVYHVYARGIRKYPIFLSDADREEYLELLEAVVVARRWRLLAYCLMGNHVHLLVETPEPDLDKGMQRLHSLYARRFNARNGFTGHLFETRYGSARARTPQRIVDWATYIALNPVAAGFCADPGDWRWSSHSAAAGGAAAPAWLDVDRLLAHFPRRHAGAKPRTGYAEIVRARLLLDHAGIAPVEPPSRKLSRLLDDDRQVASVFAESVSGSGQLPAHASLPAEVKRDDPARPERQRDQRRDRRASDQEAERDGGKASGVDRITAARRHENPQPQQLIGSRDGRGPPMKAPTTR